VTACAGEEMAVTIECNPNHKNPRDLDIKINTDFAGRLMKISSENVYRLR